MGRKLARLAGRLGCLAASSYVARPHVLADQFVPGYLGDSFGLFPFVHGHPLANQFDSPFLIRLIGEEVTHTSGFPLGIESRDPDIPSCWHSGTMRPSCCWSIPCHNQADPLSGNDTPASSGNDTPKRVGRTERAGCRTASCSDCTEGSAHPIAPAAHSAGSRVRIPLPQPSNAKRRRIGAKRNGDNAGQDAICVWDGRASHFAGRRATSSRSMQKSEEHL
jgi:hypothetical protein